MPKSAMEGSRNVLLDGDTLRKLKQHNKNIHQQKKEAAVALRQRLEEWKREKRKQQNEQQKKEEQKKRFVTTVLKPVPTKAQNVTQNKAANLRKSVNVAAKVVSKPAPEPVKRPSKPAAAKVKPHSKPQEPLGRLGKMREKENQKPVGPIKARPSTFGKPPALPKCGVVSKPHKCSKPPLSETVTPLSGNTTGFGKRHAVAYFAKGVEEGEEMVRPMSLADELQAATSGSSEATSAQSVDETLISYEHLTHITDNFNEMLNNEVVSNNTASLSQSKGASRDSLTKRFRKSKHLSHPVKKSSATTAPRSMCSSHVSTVKRVSHQSAHSTRSSMSNPHKSILKRKSMAIDVDSALGASPVLPGSKPRQKSPSTTQDRTVSLKRKLVGEEEQGQDKPAEAASSSGHVCFVTPPLAKMDSEGTHYRKTPGKAKTQEFMRSKLNEWLAAKGRTPVNFRHTACFHCDGEGSQPPAPRSQIKASMSVEQLSRQESALAKEDLLSIRKRLEWTGGKHPPISHRRRRSSSSLPPKAPTTSQAAPSSSLKGIETKPPLTRQRGNSGGQGAVRFETTDTGGETTDSTAVGKAGSVSCRKRASPSPVVEGGSEWPTSASTEQLQAEFQKCLAALESGMLRAVDALEWLNMVGEASEEARSHAGWYRCRVAVLKQLGDEDALLSAFEQAILHNAQPAEEMAQLLTTTMKELLSGHDTVRQGRRAVRSSTAERPSSPASNRRRSRSCGQQMTRAAVVQEGNMFESTVVRFSVREVTPFKKRRQTADFEEKLVSVVTPVRRSARLSYSTVPGSAGKGRLAPGTPHTTMEYSALEEVPSAEKEHMLFVRNWALESVNDVSLEAMEKMQSPKRKTFVVVPEEGTTTAAITE